MIKPVSSFLILIFAALQPLQANEKCFTLVSKANQFQVKQETAKKMALIRTRLQPYMGLAASVAELKLGYEQLAKDLSALDKDIRYLLKDSNFTSGHPSKILAATSKHHGLISRIDKDIQTTETKRQAYDAQLAELKAAATQFAEYNQNDLQGDIGTLGMMQHQIRALNITEKEVRSLLVSSMSLFTELESLPSKLQDVMQSLDSLDIKVKAVHATMENRIKMLIGQYRVYGMTNYELDLNQQNEQPQELLKTSSREEFERVPNPGELVVIDGFLGGTLVEVSADRSNLVGKKYALIDKSLVLDGIKHGDIYTDGSTTYGVIGFVEGRVMLQMVETKSYLPSTIMRLFRSVDIKALKKSFRLAGYNSYNRPILIGDQIVSVQSANDKTAPPGAVENREFVTVRTPDLSRISAPVEFDRKKWALTTWDPEDTGGIGPGMLFREDNRKVDLAEYHIVGDIDRPLFTPRTLRLAKRISEVYGILSDGTFMVREKANTIVLFHAFRLTKFGESLIQRIDDYFEGHSSAYTNIENRDEQPNEVLVQALADEWVEQQRMIETLAEHDSWHRKLDYEAIIALLHRNSTPIEASELAGNRVPKLVDDNKSYVYKVKSQTTFINGSLVPDGSVRGQGKGPNTPLTNPGIRQSYRPKFR